MASDLNTIECKQCGHHNEPERIFCHNCGAKLDREHAPALKKTEKQETPKEIKKRVTETLTPGHGLQGIPFGKFIKPLVSVLVLAAIVAALFLAAMPPEGAKPLPKMHEIADAPDLEAGLEAAAGWNLTKSFDITESQINAYLQNNVRQKKGATLAKYAPFRKCYIGIENAANNVSARARVRCTIVYSILNYPIYISDVCSFQIANHQLTATSLGGNIGRLSIPQRFSQFLSAFFQPALESLKRERQSMSKLQSVEIIKTPAREGVIRITTAPARH